MLFQMKQMEMLNMGFKEEIDGILEHTPDEKLTWLFCVIMVDGAPLMIGAGGDPELMKNDIGEDNRPSLSARSMTFAFNLQPLLSVKALGIVKLHLMGNSSVLNKNFKKNKKIIQKVYF